MTAPRSGVPATVTPRPRRNSSSPSYRHHDQVVTTRPPGVVHVAGHGSVFFMLNKFCCEIPAQNGARYVRVKLPGVSGWLVTQLSNPNIDFCPAEPRRGGSLCPPSSPSSSAPAG